MDKSTETRGDRIKAARKSMRMTQLDLAKRVGVSSVAIGHWENDRAIGNVDAIYILAKTLNVTIEWLLTGNGGNSIDDRGSGVAILDTVQERGARGTVQVPFVDASGNIDISGGSMEFTADDLARAGVDESACRCATITNRAMTPIMYPGTVAAFDSSDTTVADGEIYIVCTDVGLDVRYLYNETPTHYRMRAENAVEYPSEVAARNSVNVLGRVWWWKVLRPRK